MNDVFDSAARASLDCETTNEELYANYRDNGDVRCFETLIRRVRPILARFLATRFDFSRDELEEALQTTFLRLWQKSATFDPSRSFLPWAMRVAFSQAANMLRVRERSLRCASLDATIQTETGELGGADETPSRDEDPTRDAERRDLVEALRRALTRLPECLRRTLELVFFQGMTLQNAGMALSVATGTAQRRVQKALALLRVYMLDDGDAVRRRAFCLE